MRRNHVWSQTYFSSAVCCTRILSEWTSPCRVVHRGHRSALLFFVSTLVCDSTPPRHAAPSLQYGIRVRNHGMALGWNPRQGRTLSKLKSILIGIRSISSIKMHSGWQLAVEVYRCPGGWVLLWTKKALSVRESPSSISCNDLQCKCSSGCKKFLFEQLPSREVHHAISTCCRFISRRKSKTLRPGISVFAYGRNHCTAQPSFIAALPCSRLTSSAPAAVTTFSALPRKGSVYNAMGFDYKNIRKQHQTTHQKNNAIGLGRAAEVCGIDH